MKFYRVLFKIFLIYYVIIFQVSAQNKSEQIKGLLFPLTYSSSLDLTNEGEFYFEDSLIISFKFALNKDTDIGNIFLIEGNNNFRLFFNVMPKISKDTIFLSLNYDKLLSKIKIPLIKKEISFYDFYNIRLVLNINKQLLSFGFNDLFYNIPVYIPVDLSYQLIFGLPHNNSKIRGLNSALFKIKDVKINNDNKRISFWALDEIAGNKAYDEISKKIASHKDCFWIKSKHSFWENLINGKSILNAGITFNPITNKVLIINEKDLYEIDPVNHSFDTINFNKRRPKTANLAYYNVEKNALYSYYRGAGEVSIYDEFTKKWSEINSKNDINQHYYFHSNFTDNKGNLYIIGGYGWYVMKNHLQKYNFKSKQWDLINTSGDNLPPRAACVVAQLEDSNKIFIYGGNGNFSGKQEDGWKILNDLYLMDLNNYRIQRIWDNDFSKKGVDIFSTNGIYYKQNNSLYFIILNSEQNESLDSSNFKKSLNLAQLFIDKNNVIVFPKLQWTAVEGDNTIGSGTKSIWLDKNQNKIFAVNLKYSLTSKVDSNEFSIFSLEFPPLNYWNELQKQKSKEASLLNYEKSYLTELFIFLLISSSIVVVTIMFRNHRKKRNNINHDNLIQTTTNNERKIYLNQADKKLKNCIQVFGDFQAFDTDGNPITKLFSPKIRELFLLLLFNSFKITNQNSHGISSTKITLELWTDYSDVEAKNIRGITIHNLRQILDKFNGIDLVFENKLWLIKLKNYEIIDYVYFLTVSQLTSYNPIDQPTIDKFLILIKDGGILPYESFNWLDEQKYVINNYIIDFLFSYLNNPNSNLNHKSIIHLADKILSIDEVHEKTMILKIKELYKLGEYGKIKSTYDLFRKRYAELYAEEYEKLLDEIIKNI